jgi:uncharacterized RDD family membrane protein YckC
MSNYNPNFPNNTGFSDNPYQPAGSGQSPYFDSGHQSTAQLASLLQRFCGALLDSLLPSLFLLPGYFMMIFGAIAMEQQNQDGGNPDLPIVSILGLAIIIIGGLLTLVLQIYLLATRSQTLGKYIMKTQIVDFETGQPADFVKAAVLRILDNSIIASIPCAGAIYSLVDIFFIFRDDRRCIHDLLAGTTVIDISDR